MLIPNDLIIEFYQIEKSNGWPEGVKFEARLRQYPKSKEARAIPPYLVMDFDTVEPSGNAGYRCHWKLIAQDRVNFEGECKGGDRAMSDVTATLEWLDDDNVRLHVATKPRGPGHERSSAIIRGACEPIPT